MVIIYTEGLKWFSFS